MGAIVFVSLAFDVGPRKFVAFRTDRTDLPHLTCSWNNASNEIDMHLTSVAQVGERHWESILKIQESELRSRFQELVKQFLQLLGRSPIQFVWGVQPKWLAAMGYRLVAPRDEPVSLWFQRSFLKKRGKYRLEEEAFKRLPKMLTYCPTPKRFATLASEGQVYAISNKGLHRGSTLILAPLDLGPLSPTWVGVNMRDVERLIRGVKRSKLLPRWFSELAPGGWEKIYAAMRLEELGL
jgi:hypothetical protein